MSPQRQISKNNNHLLKYLIFQRSKSSLTNPTLITLQKLRSKNPLLEQSPGYNKITLRTFSDTSGPFHIRLGIPLEQIRKLLEWRVHAIQRGRARLFQECAQRGRRFLRWVCLRWRNQEFSTILEAFVASSPVERDAGISAVLSSKSPSKFRESAAEEGAYLPRRQARACMTLSWGQIVSTKTRDPAAGHRPRTRAANYRLARTRACTSVLARERTRTRAERIWASCETQGEFVALQVGIVTL